MFGETFVKLNYMVSYQVYLFGNHIQNKRTAHANYFRNKFVTATSDAKLYSNRHIKERNLKDLLEKSDNLYENGYYDQSLTVLNQFKATGNSQILWRQSRVLYRHAIITENKSLRQNIISKALQKLKNALEHEKENHIIHIWLSVFFCKNAQEYNMSPRALNFLNNGHIHMLQAVELAPEDPLSWFTLANYEYNIALLSWLQKRIVVAAMTNPINGTYEKALELFEKAEKLKPGFNRLNWLMIAKCYMALNKFGKAKVYLLKLAGVRDIRNVDDKESQKEAVEILQTYYKNSEKQNNENFIKLDTI